MNSSLVQFDHSFNSKTTQGEEKKTWFTTSRFDDLLANSRAAFFLLDVGRIMKRINFQINNLNILIISTNTRMEAVLYQIDRLTSYFLASQSFCLGNSIQFQGNQISSRITVWGLWNFSKKNFSSIFICISLTHPSLWAKVMRRVDRNRKRLKAT